MEEELDFFEINLPKMISDYDEAEKSKEEPVNLTGLEVVHKTVSFLNNIQQNILTVEVFLDGWDFEYDCGTK